MMPKIFENDLGYMMVVNLDGTIAGWSHHNCPILFPAQNIEHKKRGGIPLCFPWFGKHPSGGPRHGFLRDTKLNKVYELPEHGATFAGSIENKADYPWEYDTAVTFALTGNMLTSTLAFGRKDHENTLAHVNPGFHPYFAFHDGEVEILIGDEVITINDPLNEAIVKPLITQNPIMITIKGFGVIQMSLSSMFFNDTQNHPQVVVWSDGGDYFCVEPVLGSIEEYPDKSMLVDLDTYKLSMYLTFYPF